MIFTLQRHLSSVHSTLYNSHSSSHLNILACFILVTFSYLFLFYSLAIFSLIQDLFLVSLPSICALLTPILSSFTNGFHYTAIADFADTHNIDVYALTETRIFPNNTSVQLFDAIPHGFTFINKPRLISDSCTFKLLMAAQHFFSVNLKNVSSYLLLLLNRLNCLQPQWNFLTLIWLYITYIVLFNLLCNFSIQCLSLSF